METLFNSWIFWIWAVVMVTGEIVSLIAFCVCYAEYHSKLKDYHNAHGDWDRNYTRGIVQLEAKDVMKARAWMRRSVIWPLWLVYGGVRWVPGWVRTFRSNMREVKELAS